LKGDVKDLKVVGNQLISSINSQKVRVFKKNF